MATIMQQARVYIFAVALLLIMNAYFIYQVGRASFWLEALAVRVGTREPVSWEEGL